MRGKLLHELQLLVRVRGWVRVVVEFGTSSAFRGWVRVRVLGYGFGVRGMDRKAKSRDCALARARELNLRMQNGDHLPVVRSFASLTREHRRCYPLGP